MLATLWHLWQNLYKDSWKSSTLCGHEVMFYIILIFSLNIKGIQSFLKVEKDTH